MPHGGQVKVRLGLEDRHARSFVRLDVADSGPGVPAELTDTVFRPFVTTKATGTGLGLAVVKRIIDAHHGELALSSVVGEGATFSLWLPVA
jgi:signal transduction histidine kinase